VTARPQAAAPAAAMVLAAGLGTRMRDLTAERPKPLIEVAGKALIDHSLDRLAAVGVSRVVVNTYYRAEQIERHLAARAEPEIIVLRERELLDTGGGVAAALPHFAGAPFFVLNSDVVLLDGPQTALRRLARAWDDARMDALLLAHLTPRAIGYSGRGDYFMDQWGRLRRRRGNQVAPYLFAGVQILHPRLFEDCPRPPFSLNLLYDRAEAAGRLWGAVHDGSWMHVGTPEGRDEAERILRMPV